MLSTASANTAVLSECSRTLLSVRTDLTLRAPDGRERDIAVMAPDDTTFGAVAAAVGALGADVAPAWSGTQRLRPDLAIGRDALRTGSVLSAEARPEAAVGGGARLEIVGGPGAGRGIAVTGRTLVVGRAPSCDLVLSDPQASRQHAALGISGGGVLVRDLGSTQGTWVDDEAVVGERLIPPGSVVRVGDTFLQVAGIDVQVATVRRGAAGAIDVHRAPRTESPADHRVIDQPDPPAVDRPPRMQWLAALLPALVGAALAAALHSWQFLAVAALTPVALVAGRAGDRWHWRRSRRRAALRHRQAVAQAAQEIAGALRDEVNDRRRARPDPAEVERIVRTPTVRVWERRRTDPDLLSVRIGLGSAPATVQVRRQGALTPAGTLATVPHAVDLGRGAVGIAAPGRLRDSIARWLLVQLAALTSPTDVEFALLLADDDPWLWARWLPHLRGRIASTRAARAALVEELVELVQGRQAQLATGRTWAGPWLVLVVDRLHCVEPLPRLAAVLATGPTVGLTALCLADRAAGLPAGCTEIVRAAADTGSAVQVGSTSVGDNFGAPGGNPVGATVVADRVDPSWADHVARLLAPLRDAQADPAASLPDTCRLADLLGAVSATAIRRNWHGSNGSARTVLGVSAGGQPFVVDLDRDGPHALIAGTTGAGKSELLQTLVTSLAVQHPPSELTFLLIDYKGGAAFAECAELPHAVGLVTDLDDHLTRRVLSSLDSEIKRREVLFSAARVNDLAAFRVSGATLPRLVIVVDEFATLADEQSRFVPGLVAIAQRGRSLGLHLVLATQRPAGVVSPEIRANTALRIALRVASPAESADVIDGPEAATIHRRTPGRAYLRAGSTTIAFQSARVAGAAAVRPEQISVAPLGPWRRLPSAADDGSDTDLRRYVQAIAQAAAGEPPAPRPWLPPLPHHLESADLGPDDADAAPLAVPIGLIDEPAKQRQTPLVVNLAAGGPLLIVGSPRSGRTTALMGLALAATARCSPVDLQLHAIDGGGTQLAPLAGLPHAGTIADTRASMEIVARLVGRLHATLADRRGRAEVLPALLVLIDGWDALLEAAEEFDGGRTAERVLALLAEAAAARATIVLTGGRAAFAPRVAAQVATRYVLPLHDPADYGRAGIDPRSAPTRVTGGRAVRLPDGLEVQFVQAPTSTPALTSAVAERRVRWQQVVPTALRLRALPAVVRLDDLPHAPERWQLGLGGDRAAPVSIPAAATRLLIAGPARSGRSTALCLLLSQVAADVAGNLAAEVAVAAAPRSPLWALARDLGLPVLTPRDPTPELGSAGRIFLDDAELFTDTAVGDAVTDWLRSDAPHRVAVVAGRNDAVAVSFRGPAAEIRADRCGVLLQPGPVDGALLGVSLPRVRARPVPGRGVLIPHPDWQLGPEPVPIQLALP